MGSKRVKGVGQAGRRDAAEAIKPAVPAVEQPTEAPALPAAEEGSEHVDQVMQGGLDAANGDHKPDATPEPDDAAKAAMEVAAAQMDRFREDALKRMDEMGQAFEEKMSQVADTCQQSSDANTIAISELKDDLGKRLKGVDEGISKLEKATSGYGKAIDDLGKGVDKRLQGISDTVAKTQQEAADATKNVDTLIKDIGSLKTVVDEQLKAFKGGQETVVDELTALGDRMKVIEEKDLVAKGDLEQSYAVINARIEALEGREAPVVDLAPIEERLSQLELRPTMTDIDENAIDTRLKALEEELARLTADEPIDPDSKVASLPEILKLREHRLKMSLWSAGIGDRFDDLNKQMVDVKKAIEDLKTRPAKVTPTPPPALQQPPVTSEAPAPAVEQPTPVEPTPQPRRLSNEEYRQKQEQERRQALHNLRVAIFNQLTKDTRRLNGGTPPTGEDIAFLKDEEYILAVMRKFNAARQTVRDVLIAATIGLGVANLENLTDWTEEDWTKFQTFTVNELEAIA